MIVKGITILRIFITIVFSLITIGWIVVCNLVDGFEIHKVLSFIALLVIFIIMFLINKMRKDKHFLYGARNWGQPSNFETN